MLLVTSGFPLVPQWHCVTDYLQLHSVLKTVNAISLNRQHHGSSKNLAKMPGETHCSRVQWHSSAFFYCGVAFLLFFLLIHLVVFVSLVQVLFCFVDYGFPPVWETGGVVSLVEIWIFSISRASRMILDQNFSSKTIVFYSWKLIWFVLCC